MALTDKLTAIADAVRGKTGGADALTLEQMASEIAGIKSNPVIRSLEITENGTYTAPSGVDGYSPITVSVAASGGGGLTVQSGTLTPAQDTTNIRITGLPFAPKLFVASLDIAQSEITNGVAKMIGGMYTPYMKATFRTNAMGTGNANDAFYILFEDETPLADDVPTTSAPDNISLLTSGILIYREGYFFRAGIPIKWIAVG